MGLLKGTGSAVYILSPTSKRAGKMDLWLWRFLLWAGEEFNLIQNAYWWNTTALANGGAPCGLLRNALRYCVWVGPAACYRAQEEVLWEESKGSKDNRERRLRRHPGPHPKDEERSHSGAQTNRWRLLTHPESRGGVLPFNVLPIAGAVESAGHPDGKPLALLRWWVKYLCPPGGSVLDPFCGSGTTGLACLERGVNFTGIEKERCYVELARRRLANSPAACPLFAAGG
jgi:hypothetical protein